jgi:predicted aldo/keto reductase-like oxidoreductase
MRYVKLGRTGLTVSEFGFGCIPIIRLVKEDSVTVLRYALERGINFFDTANAYRDSEEKIGKAFDGMRDRVVLASKTLKRDGAGALEQLENSLRMMKTDYLDLYQLHQIAQEEDWRKVTAPGGALEAVMKAKEAGKVRHVGVTSHSLPMAIRMVQTGLFDTIQFPFNLIEEAANDELLGAALEKGMGFICMKPFAGGVIDDAQIAFKYLRTCPDMIPIPGFESCRQVDQVLSIYSHDNVISARDQEIMENYRNELGKVFCRRCEYCQPCPEGVIITPAMGYPIFVKRMSAPVAVEFCRKAMESVPNCTECGDCIKRCPYELKIPDIIKANYALYEEHLKGKEG